MKSYNEYIEDDKNLFEHSIDEVVYYLNNNPDICWFVHNSNFDKLLIYDKKTSNIKICYSNGKDQSIFSIKRILNEPNANIPPLHLHDIKLVYNPDDTNFYLFGGRIYYLKDDDDEQPSSNTSNNLWTKNTSVWCFVNQKNSEYYNEWVEYKQNYTPKQSCEFSICYSKFHKSFILFGGYSFDSNKRNLENSIWFYSLEKNTWIFESQLLKLSYSNVMPTKRRNSFMACHDELLLLFSGIGENDCIYYDTWLLNFENVQSNGNIQWLVNFENIYNNENVQWVKLCNEVYKTFAKKTHFYYEQIQLYYKDDRFVMEIKDKILYKLNIADRIWENYMVHYEQQQEEEEHDDYKHLDEKGIDNEQHEEKDEEEDHKEEEGEEEGEKNDDITYVVYTYFNATSYNLSIITVEENTKNIIYQCNYDFFYNFDTDSKYDNTLTLKYIPYLNISVFYNAKHQLEIWKDDEKKIYELGNSSSSFVINLNKLFF